MQYARYGRMRLGRCVKVCIVMQYARYGRMRLGHCVKVCIVMQYAHYGRMRLGRCVKVCIVMQYARYGRIRCTLSNPNWVFVFMASVNYISRCHGSFLNCVTCHELY